MSEYFIRGVQEADYAGVAAVYNSNPHFLLKHLDMNCIDAAFVAEETAKMRKVGFLSCVIVEKESLSLQGVLDYKPGSEVYLSLLMLAGNLQGKGIGRGIYSGFESRMQRNGSASIRIDVVNDYFGNVVPFWKSLGFAEGEVITLEWGNKRSKAVVMRKSL